MRFQSNITLIDDCGSKTPSDKCQLSNKYIINYIMYGKQIHMLDINILNINVIVIIDKNFNPISH